MLPTCFTDLVGCTVPIQQAGMGAVAPPALAAAVSNAGGLGMVGTARWGGHSLPGLQQLLDETHVLTDRPFGVNIVVSDPHLASTDPACFALAAKHAALVEFFWRWPDRALIETVHAQGALVSWQVGSQAEAAAAQEAGVDLIVAQGVGAGGHVRGTIGVLALLDEVLDVVDVPVLAAGGLGSGRGVAAVLAAGAAGARLGTRFLAAPEADVHPQYLAALLAAKAADTMYSWTFNDWWDAPGRTLRSAVDAVNAFPGDLVGETPSLDGTRELLPRYYPEAVNRGTTGTIAAMSLWAGESVGRVTQVQSAAEIVREVAEEAERLLSRWGSSRHASAR